MGKLNALLDELTIINFRFIWKLVLRYKKIALIFAFLFVTSILYFYYSQPIIQALAVHFRTNPKHAVSQDLISLLPVENNNQVTISDLNVNLTSVSFLKLLAENCLAEKIYDKMDFGNISRGESFLGYKIKESCNNDKKCLMDKTSQALQGLFSVENGLTDNHFVLNVLSIDKNTTVILARILVRTINQSRTQNKQRIIVEELGSVNRLILESRAQIAESDGFNVLEEQEKLQFNITDLKDKMRSLQLSLNIERNNLSSMEIKLTQSRKLVKENNKSFDDALNKEKLLKLRAKMNEIRQNISSLTSIAQESRTDSDKLVLAKLTEELKQLEKESPELAKIRSIAYEEAFVEKEQSKGSDYHFDYMVAKNKVERLEREYVLYQKELDKYIEQKVKQDTKLNALKADMEFLKNLETKQVSLKLILSTINTDLFFEEVSEYPRSYRRSTVIKLVAFSFFLSFFIYIIVLSLVYFFDDRIYSDDDLKTVLGKYQVLGQAPKFD